MFYPFGPVKIWRFLTDFWTILIFILLIVNLVYPGRFTNLISPLSIIYVAILGLFVSTKEFKRWSNSDFQQRLGEVYIVLWTILLFTLIILGIFDSEHYEIAPEIVATYLSLMSIFALSRKSKSSYLKSKKEEL